MRRTAAHLPQPLIWCASSSKCCSSIRYFLYDFLLLLGYALYRLNQVGNKIISALEIHIHSSPLLINGLLCTDELVIAASQHCTYYDDNDHQSDYGQQAALTSHIHTNTLLEIILFYVYLSPISL